MKKLRRRREDASEIVLRKSLKYSSLRDSTVSKKAVGSIVSVLSNVKVQKSPQLKASNVRNRKTKASTETALPDLALFVPSGDLAVGG
jgi:hypothetical protein